VDRRPSHAPKHLHYHELLEQLRRPGCAVCALGAAAARRSLESLAGESVTDPDARERWRESFGLCAPHARRFEAEAPRLTVAILFGDLLRRMEGELESRPRLRRPPSPAPCPACTAAAEQEEASLRVLAESIDEPGMAEAYGASSGLCRRHTLGLLPRLPKTARARVAAEERERLRRLGEELAEVQRKHDYRFAGEPWGEEKTAPARAVTKITGEPG
jgi:hypothetical protein